MSSTPPRTVSSYDIFEVVEEVNIMTYECEIEDQSHGMFSDKAAAEKRLKTQRINWFFTCAFYWPKYPVFSALLDEARSVTSDTTDTETFVRNALVSDNELFDKVFAEFTTGPNKAYGGPPMLTIVARTINPVYEDE